MSILDEIKNRYADYRLNKVNNLENSVNNKEGSLRAAPASPEKSMPDKLEITIKTVLKQLSIAKNMEYTVKSLKNNPDDLKIISEDDFIEKLENYAHSIGIDRVGYTKVPSEFIFKDKSVLFENTIVLIMEMDKKSINDAPSPQTQEMGIVIYDELGKKTNMIAQFLRKNGFAAHANHPAGGIVMYPHLAEVAGLGCRGRHGMLITPEFGPRQRISTVFTSVRNLPFNRGNEHSWIPDFCDKCGSCVRKCPDNAILEEKLPDGEIRTKIIKELCHGCTICMRECQFNKREYMQIKDKHGKLKVKD